MNILANDPIVLICSGVILMGLVFFVWAVGRLRQSKSAAPADLLTPPDDLAAATDLPPINDARRSPGLTPTPRSMDAAPVAARDSREISDRLEAMTQKLTEMQSVLNKQATPAVGGASPAPLGQGFSPETIDKLLSIIGNVISQVEILQRSMGPKPLAAGAGGAPRPSAGSPTSAQAMAAASGGVIFPPGKAPGSAPPSMKPPEVAKPTAPPATPPPGKP